MGASVAEPFFTEFLLSSYREENTNTYVVLVSGNVYPGVNFKGIPEALGGECFTLVQDTSRWKSEETEVIFLKSKDTLDVVLNKIRKFCLNPKNQVSLFRVFETTDAGIVWQASGSGG